VEFVVDKVALGQIFSKYFGFPCQFSFHQILDTHLSSGASTIDQLVAHVPTGLSLTATQETKINKQKLRQPKRKLKKCRQGRHAVILYPTKKIP
jgi:hypothetical protein